MAIKASSHGIVVEHKETDIRYAVSDKNYNEKIHRKVRDLKPGETVLTYQPKRKADQEEDAPSVSLDASSSQSGPATDPADTKSASDVSGASTESRGSGRKAT